MIHEDIQLTGSFQASGSFNAPLHAGTGSALEETGSIFNDTTDNTLKVYDGNNWLIVGENTASIIVPSADIEYLVVAGGGGGGGWGGGGGAGGLLSSSLSSVQSGSSFTVTIGGGATATGRSGGSYVAGGDGTDSSIAGTTISTITSTGGGGGGYYDGNVGRGGGSGGGGGIRSSNGTVAGGSGTTGQGKDGGLGAGNNTNNPYSGGGGGGGAGAVGSDGQSSGYYYGGDGGDGKQSNITGTPTYYAGGGGGHTDGRTVNAPSVSSGGQGGGGNGGRYGGSSGATNAQDGTANTGGGGGSAWGDDPTYGVAGGGGSGVAIFAYNSGSVNGAGGIVGDADNGRKYNQFNTTGTFKVGSTSDFSIVTDSLEVHLDAGNFASRGTSTWTDLSGNGRNFTANNGPVLGNNFYYDLDGSNDYFGDVSYQVNDYMTIMTWIKPDSLVSSDGVIDINTSGNNGGFALGSRSNNNIGLTWRDDAWSSGGYPYLADNTNLVDSNWHCIAGVYDGNAYLYVDDMSTAAQSDTSRNSTLTQVSGQYIRIGLLGNQSSTYALDGGIGMVMIYSKALTTTELLQNYNATKTNFV